MRIVPRILQIPETPNAPRKRPNDPSGQKSFHHRLTVLQQFQPPRAVVIMDDTYVVRDQDIVNQRHHLVPDAFDAMRAASVVEQPDRHRRR
jgi:hypothetical protein